MSGAVTDLRHKLKAALRGVCVIYDELLIVDQEREREINHDWCIPMCPRSDL